VKAEQDIHQFCEAEEVLRHFDLVNLVASRIHLEVEQSGSLREQEQNSFEQVFAATTVELYRALGESCSPSAFQQIHDFVSHYSGDERLKAILFAIESVAHLHPAMILLVASRLSEIVSLDLDSKINLQSVEEGLRLFSDELSQVRES